MVKNRELFAHDKLFHSLSRFVRFFCAVVIFLSRIFAAATMPEHSG